MGGGWNRRGTVGVRPRRLIDIGHMRPQAELATRTPARHLPTRQKRNVVDHLPKERQEWVKRQMTRAYEELDHHKAKRDLEHLADTLEDQHPGAAGSLREGLAETLTVIRLGLPALLKDTVSSTNSIESAFAMVRDTTRNVKRWRVGRAHV